MDQHEQDLLKLLAGTHKLVEQYLRKPGHSTSDVRFAKLAAVRDSIVEELAQYRFRTLGAVADFNAN